MQVSHEQRQGENSHVFAKIILKKIHGSVFHTMERKWENILTNIPAIEKQNVI